MAFSPPMNRSLYPQLLVPHALVQKTAKPALTLVLPRQALLHLQLLRGAAPRHFLLPGTPEGSASQQGWLSNRHNQIPQAESNQFACLLQLQKAVSLSLCHSWGWSHLDNYVRIRSRRNEGNTSRNVTQDTLLREIFWKNVFGIILKLNLGSSSVKGKTKATSTGFRGKYPSLT